MHQIARIYIVVPQQKRKNTYLETTLQTFVLKIKS